MRSFTESNAPQRSANQWITYSRGVAKCPLNLLGNWLIVTDSARLTATQSQLHHLSRWQTVQVSRTRNSYEKLGWIRTMFYSVRETWSHVIEMLRRYWLEIRFVFFTLFSCWLLLVVSSFFAFLAILFIMECYPEKIKMWNSLSSLSSAMFLVRETWMVLCATCIQISCAKFLVQETWTVCHQL